MNVGPVGSNIQEVTLFINNQLGIIKRGLTSLFTGSVVNNQGELEKIDGTLNLNVALIVELRKYVSKLDHTSQLEFNSKIVEVVTVAEKIKVLVSSKLNLFKLKTKLTSEFSQAQKGFTHEDLQGIKTRFFGSFGELEALQATFNSKKETLPEDKINSYKRLNSEVMGIVDDTLKEVNKLGFNPLPQDLSIQSLIIYCKYLKKILVTDPSLGFNHIRSQVGNIGVAEGKACASETERPKEILHLKGVRHGLNSLIKHVQKLKTGQKPETQELLSDFEKELKGTLSVALELISEILMASLPFRTGSRQ